MAQWAFTNSVDQDQSAQNVQSDLWSTLSALLFWVITKLPPYLFAGLYNYVVFEKKLVFISSAYG